MERRSLLTRAIFAIPALVGGGLAALAATLGFSTSSWRQAGKPRWLALCRVDEITGEKPLDRTIRFARLEGWYWQKVERKVYVTRLPDDQPVVFDRLCTHLSCPVTWRSKSQSFRCPCHGGVFAADGAVTGGPPPAPLHRVPHRIRDGLLEVQGV